MRSLGLSLIILFTSSLAFAGGSRNFDGNDYVLISAGNNQLNGLTSYTVSFWFKGDNVTQNVTFPRIISNGINDDLEIATKNSQMQHFNRNTDAAWLAFGTVSNSIWHHVAITADGGGTDGYLDGVKTDLSAVALSNGVDGVLHIGDRYNASAEGHDGLIANVRIYNRALSAAEIQTSIQCFNLPIRGLVSRYSLNEVGSNPKFRDYSGQGANGTNNGSTESADGPPTSWCGS